MTKADEFRAWISPRDYDIVTMFTNVIFFLGWRQVINKGRTGDVVGI